MSLPETNLTLIARLKSPADQQAWSDFVGAYEPFLMSVLKRRGLSDADSRDVLQQILISVCRSLPNWTPDGQEASFRRWISGVCRNTLLKFLRHRQRHPSGVGGSDFLIRQSELQSPDDPSAGERQDYAREVFHYAANLVRSEFQESSWRVFQATTIEGRPVDEVAREMKVERGAIYMSRSRIMARIRARVAELWEDDSPR